MTYKHCDKPMEVLAMPSKAPIAAGMIVGFRCVVCFEVVPNFLIHTLERQDD